MATVENTPPYTAPPLPSSETELDPETVLDQIADESSVAPALFADMPAEAREAFVAYVGGPGASRWEQLRLDTRLDVLRLVKAPVSNANPSSSATPLDRIQQTLGQSMGKVRAWAGAQVDDVRRTVQQSAAQHGEVGQQLGSVADGALRFGKKLAGEASNVFEGAGAWVADGLRTSSSGLALSNPQAHRDATERFLAPLQPPIAGFLREGVQASKRLFGDASGEPAAASPIVQTYLEQGLPEAAAVALAQAGELFVLHKAMNSPGRISSAPAAGALPTNASPNTFKVEVVTPTRNTQNLALGSGEALSSTSGKALRLPANASARNDVIDTTGVEISRSTALAEPSPSRVEAAPATSARAAQGTDTMTSAPLFKLSPWKTPASDTSSGAQRDWLAAHRPPPGGNGSNLVSLELPVPGSAPRTPTDTFGSAPISLAAPRGGGSGSQTPPGTPKPPTAAPADSVARRFEPDAPAFTGLYDGFVKGRFFKPGDARVIRRDPLDTLLKETTAYLKGDEVKARMVLNEFMYDASAKTGNPAEERHRAQGLLASAKTFREYVNGRMRDLGLSRDVPGKDQLPPSDPLDLLRKKLAVDHQSDAVGLALIDGLDYGDLDTARFRAFDLLNSRDAQDHWEDSRFADIGDDELTALRMANRPAPAQRSDFELHVPPPADPARDRSVFPDTRFVPGTSRTNLLETVGNKGHLVTSDTAVGGTGRALSAHGGLEGDRPLMTVANGSAVTMPGPGTALADHLGLSIEAGDWTGFTEATKPERPSSRAQDLRDNHEIDPDLIWSWTALPGARIPDYRFTAPEDVSAMSRSVTINDGEWMRLSEIAVENSGHTEIAACVVIKRQSVGTDVGPVGYLKDPRNPNAVDLEEADLPGLYLPDSTGRLVRDVRSMRESFRDEQQRFEDRYDFAPTHLMYDERVDGPPGTNRFTDGEP